MSMGLAECVKSVKIKMGVKRPIGAVKFPWEIGILICREGISLCGTVPEQFHILSDLEPKVLRTRMPHVL